MIVNSREEKTVEDLLRKLENHSFIKGTFYPSEHPELMEALRQED
ncbi:MAG TPA: hypothetical protein VL053_18215 [Arachidicoccus sp.]|nr:hypothetical protein [Arachidicoccus sp.]